MKIELVLYLLGLKGLSVLKSAVIFKDSLLITVVLGRDAQIQNDYALDIIALAKHNNLKVVERSETVSLNINDKTWKLASGWRWLLPNPSNLIVIHDSILPKYRGFNPLVTALINGDNEIGCTALLADDGIDTGPILMQKSCKISYPLKISEAILIIAEQYGQLTKTLLKQLISNELVARPQDSKTSSFSLWRDEVDYIINWEDNAINIKRFIDAVSFPYNGASAVYLGKSIRVLEAEVTEDVNIVNRSPGKLFSVKGSEAVVVCGEGLLNIKKAIYEDGTAVTFSSLRQRL